tara:strand:+ start:913 stop:1563 length:651 start_codon:yes stop_codon:yes gene_type:complete
LKLEDHVVELTAGKLIDGDGQSSEYQIFFGNSLRASLAADAQWSQWNYQLLESVEEALEKDPTKSDYIEQLSLEDAHWKWAVKAQHLSTDEYLWFYLFVNGDVQGICLLYHPKDSMLRTAKIFYVEYIAVAPWNRSQHFNVRKFRGVGSRLLRISIKYCVEKLGLELGFSLHSLPKAEAYYEKIGMKKIEGAEKGGLAFFEMPSDQCEKLLGSLDE